MLNKKCCDSSVGSHIYLIRVRGSTTSDISVYSARKKNNVHAGNRGLPTPPAGRNAKDGDVHPPWPSSQYPPITADPSL